MEKTWNDKTRDIVFEGIFATIVGKRGIRVYQLLHNFINF